jgi:hypothetical protein
MLAGSLPVDPASSKNPHQELHPGQRNRLSDSEGKYLTSRLGSSQAAFPFPLTPDVQLATYCYHHASILLELPEFVKPGQAAITCYLRIVSA